MVSYLYTVVSDILKIYMWLFNHDNQICTEIITILKLTIFQKHTYEISLKIYILNKNPHINTDFVIR
jgi:hypothetical protein